MSNETHIMTVPEAAMVLAAGLGTRMRPLTLTRPKPLVELAGKALLDHALDHLDDALVHRVVINVHYLGEQIIEHLRGRKGSITISDERDALLDTGGGVAKALKLLGARPFYLVNSDSTWRDDRTSALFVLAEQFDEERMDGILLLVPPERSLGYDGSGDFRLGPDGRIARAAGGGAGKAYVYMGVAILHPRLFRGAPEGAFSLNVLFDRAIKEGRLFGCVHQHMWMHVGTPEALTEAEDYLARTQP